MINKIKSTTMKYNRHNKMISRSENELGITGIYITNFSYPSKNRIIEDLGVTTITHRLNKYDDVVEIVNEDITIKKIKYLYDNNDNKIYSFETGVDGIIETYYIYDKNNRIVNKRILDNGNEKIHTFQNNNDIVIETISFKGEINTIIYKYKEYKLVEKIKYTTIGTEIYLYKYDNNGNNIEIEVYMNKGDM